MDPVGIIWQGRQIHLPRTRIIFRDWCNQVVWTKHELTIDFISLLPQPFVLWEFQEQRA